MSIENTSQRLYAIATHYVILYVFFTDEPTKLMEFYIRIYISERVPVTYRTIGNRINAIVNCPYFRQS